MVDLLGITCDGDGVSVIALISESCWRQRHKSSASVSYSSSLSLSKSVLNDIYCTSRLNGGESGTVSIKPVVLSIETSGKAGKASTNNSRNLVFVFSECIGSTDNDVIKVLDEEGSNKLAPRFRLMTRRMVPLGKQIKLGRDFALRWACTCC